MATITATELAVELNTTGREVRKFLRADAKAKNIPTPGKGARYAIEKKQIASLKKRFAAWDEARTAKVEDAPAPDADTAHTPTIDAPEVD